MERIETDLLVIGSGAAGLTSAVYAAQQHKRVLVLDKGAVSRSGSSVGAVQIAGLGNWTVDDDGKDSYFHDIEASGRGLSNPELAQTLVDEIDERINDLTQWGMKLDQNEQKEIAVSHTSGHSHPRSVSAKKGKTGLGILHTLRRKALKTDDITLWSDVITLELIKANDQVVGAVVLDLTTMKPYQIVCHAVILATGGAGQLFPITSNPVQSTGDGFALGLGVGASLIDMEQIQFYPVSMAHPNSIAGFCISFYHYSKLFNNKGERFMKNYAPETLEDATRDVLSIAIATEIAEGRGTDHGAIWLDATDVIDQVQLEFPHEYQLCQDRGIDLSQTQAEIGPAAHFMMGGIRINRFAESEVPGLFVAGETSGGLHGGNRLGNNALSECLVFGAKAGIQAAKFSQGTLNTQAKAHKADAMLQTIFSNKPGNLRPFEVKNSIQSILSKHVGVIRTTSSLQKANIELKKLQKQLSDVAITNQEPYSREVIDMIEANHMLKTAQAIVQAALLRKESRGAHYTKDFPNPSEKNFHTIAKLNRDGIQVHEEGGLD